MSFRSQSVPARAMRDPHLLPVRAVTFDRVARVYRIAEHLLLGRSLSRARCEHLPALGNTRRALVLGDGDGRFLAALLRAAPGLRATAVDSSGEMLRLLSERCSFAMDRVEVWQADVLSSTQQLQPPPWLAASPGYDLIATHFFLDCFTETEIARLVPAIRGCLQPGGLWVLSEFRVPPRGLFRLPARLVVRVLYLVFRALTGLRPTRLPPFASHLREAGLVPVCTRHSLAGLLTAELWQLPGRAAGRESEGDAACEGLVPRSCQTSDRPPPIR